MSQLSDDLVRMAQERAALVDALNKELKSKRPDSEIAVHVRGAGYRAIAKARRIIKSDGAPDARTTNRER